MDWQVVAALAVVGLAVWGLVRKMRGKSGNAGNCEGCAPAKDKKTK